MAKKTTSFRLEPAVTKKIKIWAAENELSLGDAISRMVTMLESDGQLRHRAFRKKETPAA